MTSRAARIAQAIRNRVKKFAKLKGVEIGHKFHKDIAKRRAANKAAAKSRKINRRVCA